jgi:hypothetical protein
MFIERSRTSRQSARAKNSRKKTTPPDRIDGARLLTRVLRDVLAAETFEHESDVIEAFKCRLARLRIPWTNDGLTEALRVVGSNRPFVQAPPTTPEPAPEATGPIIGPDEARALLAAIRARLGQVPLRTITPAAWRDPEADAKAEEEARQRAAEMGITL